LRTLDTKLKMALVRLAHTLMPAEPCGCKIVQARWEQDRKIPAVVTREQLNSGFGAMDGAWFAYKVCQSARLKRMSVF